jgi:F-type H+-transporting ATPase subunit delta
MTAAQPQHATTHDNLELFRQVDRVYGLTLLELAEKAGQPKEIAQEMAAIRQLSREQPDLIKLLSSRLLPMEARFKSLEKIFQGRVSDLVFRFLKLLVKKNRFEELEEIAGAFAHLVDQRYGVLEVETFTAQPLEASLRQRIVDQIHRLTQRQVRLREHVQPELIGGLRLRVGDEVLDGSTLSQLRRMREQIIAAGRERVRLALDSHLDA